MRIINAESYRARSDARKYNASSALCATDVSVGRTFLSAILYGNGKFVNSNGTTINFASVGTSQTNLAGSAVGSCAGVGLKVNRYDHSSRPLPPAKSTAKFRPALSINRIDLRIASN